MDDLDDVLRARVKAHVTERGWTLRETAERFTGAGFPATHPVVQRLLDGSRKVTVAEWLAIAVALSEPPLSLLLPVRSKRYRVAGASATGDRIEAWIEGSTPLDTVPEPRRYRASAGRPTRSGETDFAGMLRHMADVYDGSSRGDRPDAALQVLQYAAGNLRAERFARRRGESDDPIVMASLDMSNVKRQPRKRTRKSKED